MVYIKSGDRSQICQTYQINTTTKYTAYMVNNLVKHFKCFYKHFNMDVTICFHHSKNIIFGHNVKWSHKIDKKLLSTVYINDVAMIICTHSNNMITHLLVTLHSANAFAALNLPDTSTNLQMNSHQCCV